MKLRHELEVEGHGQRVNTEEQPRRVVVRLELTLEGVRGEPLVGVLQDALRQSGDIAAKTLDRRPY